MMFFPSHVAVNNTEAVLEFHSWTAVNEKINKIVSFQHFSKCRCTRYQIKDTDYFSIGTIFRLRFNLSDNDEVKVPSISIFPIFLHVHISLTLARYADHKL